MKTNPSLNDNYFYVDATFVSVLKSYSKDKEQLINDKSEAIIRQFENKLGLSYISESSAETNLCFANNDDIRTEFKQTFTAIDILDYIESFLHTLTTHNISNIPYPKDTKIFWKMVELGSKTRKS